MPPVCSANPNIRIIVNQNDFLLADEDLAWLQTTFARNKLTVFEQGGHLGNLSQSRGAKGHFGSAGGFEVIPAQI